MPRHGGRRGGGHSRIGGSRIGGIHHHHGIGSHSAFRSTGMHRMRHRTTGHTIHFSSGGGGGSGDAQDAFDFHVATDEELSGYSNTWSSHLFGCCGSGRDFCDWFTITTCCCPMYYLALGRISGRLSNSEDMGDGCNCACCLIWGMELNWCTGTPIFGTQIRQGVASRYQLNETCCDSCIITSFCPCCSVAQMNRELGHHDEYPGNCCAPPDAPNPESMVQEEEGNAQHNNDDDNNASDSNNQNFIFEGVEMQPNINFNNSQQQSGGGIPFAVPIGGQLPPGFGPTPAFGQPTFGVYDNHAASPGQPNSYDQTNFATGVPPSYYGPPPGSYGFGSPLPPPQSQGNTNSNGAQFTTFGTN